MPRTLTQRASRSRETQGGGGLEREREGEIERSRERERAWTIYGWLLVIVCTVDQGRMETRLQRQGFFGGLLKTVARLMGQTQAGHRPDRTKSPFKCLNVRVFFPLNKCKVP